MAFTEKDADRFWAKVRRGPECWTWTGPRTKHGYGTFSKGGKKLGAHRVAWELHRGAPPDGSVLHSCDNPACVRPRHLFVGDQAANMQDMVVKGRHSGPYGRTRLSASAVRAIREAHASGFSEGALAKIHGVTQHNISLVVNKRTWRHVH